MSFPSYPTPQPADRTSPSAVSTRPLLIPEGDIQQREDWASDELMIHNELGDGFQEEGDPASLSGEGGLA